MKNTNFYGCGMPPRNLKLDPLAETQGGNVTTDTEQAPAPIPEPYNLGFARNENSANTETLPPVDWDKEAGTEIKFNDPANQPYIAPKTALEREKENEKQNLETREEGEQKDEVEVQKAPEAQTDDKGEQFRGTEKSNVIDEVIKEYPAFEVLKKKMSKEAVEFTRARLQEGIELKRQIAERDEIIKTTSAGKTVIPQSYYENPNAYMLLPEFHQASFGVALAKKAVDHWRQQKFNVRNGREWQELEEVRDSKGNLIDFKASDKLNPANGDADANIDEYLQDCREQLNTIASFKNNIQSTFSAKVTQVREQIKQVEAELYPPATWENKETPQYNVTANVKKALADMGHSESNPLFNLLAKSGAQVLILRDYIANLQKKDGKATAIAADTKKAGPSGTITNGTGSGSSNKNAEDVAASFQKLKPSSRW